METGELRRILFEKTEDVEVMKVFQGVYGVGLCPPLLHVNFGLISGFSGRAKARQWHNAGCRTLEDIKRGKAGKLSSAQKIGLEFYDGQRENTFLTQAIKQGPFKQTSTRECLERRQVQYLNTLSTLVSTMLPACG